MKKQIGSTHSVIILLATLIFSAAALPQGTGQSPLPAPTGPYSVGRAYFDWVDHSRPDPHSSTGYREIVVWVWYPASPKSSAKPAEWMPGKWGELFWSDYLQPQLSKLPQAVSSEVNELIKQHPISSILSHSYEDAPMAPGHEKFPILLFEPGNKMIPLMYTSLLEDMASHGYIVAGIVPTYSAFATVFSDGRIVKNTDAGVVYPPPPPPSQAQAGVNGHLMTLEQFQTLGDQSRLVAVDDATLTLHQLKNLDADAHSIFKGRCDFKKVGVFGHSAGGSSSFTIANDVPGVRAALDIDGRDLSTDLIKTGLPKPLLIFRSAEYLQDEKDAKRAPDNPIPKDIDHLHFLFMHGRPGYHLVLAGTTHGFSTDEGMLPFLPQSVKAEMGSIDPARALAVTKAYVRAFFDQYVKAKKSPLLDGPSPKYPEITFETNKNR